MNFQKFLNDNNINTSFLRAYFLHLISDYLFFGEYITRKDIENLSFVEIRDKGYADYNRMTPKIIKKYNLEIPEEIKDIVSGVSDGKLEIINEEQVYAYNFEGTRYDVGSKVGFVKATIDFALDRDDLKEEIIDFIKNKNL